MEYKYHHNPPYESGNEIYVFQDRLNYIRNTYHYGWDHINADGVFGRRTRNAVKGFQGVFMGQVGSGNLDERTQSLINSKYYECQRGYSANPGVARCYDPNYNYIDQGYGDIANCTAGPPVYRPSGGNSFSETANKAPKGGDDMGFTLEYFKKNYTDNFYALCNDIRGILAEVMDMPIGKKMIDAAISRLKDLSPKIYAFCEMVGNDISRLGNIVAAKVDDITKPLQRHADRWLKAIKANPEGEIAKFMKRGGGKGGVLGIVTAGLPMLYYLIMWMVATITGGDTEYYKGKFFDNMKGFIGSIIIMAATELLGIALVALGVAAGTAGLVVVIVTIVVAVIDIIVMGFTDKGIADWIMIGLGNVGEYLGDSLYEALHPDVPKAYTVEELNEMGYDENGFALVSGHAR